MDAKKYAITIYYDGKKHEALIKEAIKQLNQKVFDCWIYPPEVEVSTVDFYDEPEIEVSVGYHNPENPDEDCIRGHECVDLIHAFLEGCIWAAERNTTEGKDSV